MISIREITEEDIKKYESVFYCVYELFNDYCGLYYLLNINGEETVLHRLDSIFTLFTVDTHNRISYSMFSVNDHYEVIDAGFDDFEVHIVDGVLTVQNRHTEIVESLNLIKRADGCDMDGYDGTVIYSQYDPKSDIRAVITYQQMYNKNKQIYSIHVEVPFIYSLETNMTSKRTSKQYTYIKGEYQYYEEPYIFNLVTIKDYGLREFLKQGSLKLQKNSKVIRYHKVLGYSTDKRAITGFPLTTQYTNSDIQELFKSYGFKDSIPKYLLDLYNGNYQEMNLFKEIVLLLKDIEKKPIKEEVIEGDELVLKFTLNNGNKGY